jgi:hypothetical protein
VLRQGENGYEGCADTRISRQRPDSNYGTGELVLGDRGGARSLVRFDVASIPSNALVRSATLSLLVSNFGQRDRLPITVSAYSVLRPWVEMEATWNQARKNDVWDYPGCDGIGTDRSGTAVDTRPVYGLGWYTWDVTTPAQDWVAAPDHNFGVVFIQTNIEVGGEFDVRESEYPGVEVRPFLIITYVIPTPTPEVSYTPTATATSTATQTPTATASATVTPTGTRTTTPTAFATATQTEMPTPTTTSLPEPWMLYLPSVQKTSPQRCIEWGYTFQEEFLDPSLSGWEVSLAGGSKRVQDSVLHEWTQPYSDRFPMVWRNDLFEGSGESYLFEAKWRHSNFTAYGTTVGLNSAPFDGNRIPAATTKPGVEDMISIHHVVDPSADIRRFEVIMFRDAPYRVEWHGTPGDSDWHVVRITLEDADLYTLYVDDTLVGTAKSPIRPQSVYIGNPTIQPFFGPWTNLYVDYIRISHCVEWGPY